MTRPKFVISRFTNKHSSSWRVTGLLHGLRIRRNFKTREEAAAEKALLEIKALQAFSNLRPVTTSVTESQVREAEAVYQRIAGKHQPLSFYVDYALANYRAPSEEKRLTEAIAAYVATKGGGPRGHCSKIKSELSRRLTHLRADNCEHDPHSRFELRPFSRRVARLLTLVY